MSRKPKPLDARQRLMLSFAEKAAENRQPFFYILIRESIGPMKRAKKYEEPLADALGDLGEITGGGSQLGENKAIAFCGLDIVVNDRDRGLKIIRQCLLSIGAGPDTVIEEYVPEFKELRL